MRHTEAISLIKRGGDVVRLKVVRPPPQLDRHVAGIFIEVQNLFA